MDEYIFPKTLTTDDPFARAVANALERNPALRSSRNAEAEVGLEKRRILVAISGGPDSTALLGALIALRRSAGFELHAVHVNHLLRGQESDLDEKFCADLCAHFAVPLVRESLDGSRRDEDSLRRARYGLIQAHASKLSIDYVCTGHTRDDQLETVLFRLFRGTGPAGLIGMKAERKLSDESHCLLVRPLLTLTRADVLSFLGRQSMPSRLDSSNSDSRYARNYLRNAIIPPILQRFGTVSEQVTRLSLQMEEDECLLQSLTENALMELRASHIDIAHQMSSPGNRLCDEHWSLRQFNAFPASIRRRLIARAYIEREVKPVTHLVEQTLKLAREGTGVASLNSKWEVRAEKETLDWCWRASPRFEPTFFAVELQVPGRTISDEFGCLIVTEVNHSEQSDCDLEIPAANAYEALVDLAHAGAPLLFRMRKPGDVIQPFGMKQQVRLKKFLHTHKPQCSIGALAVPLIANSDEVLWVPGFGLSEKLRIRSRPTHRLLFRRTIT